MRIRFGAQPYAQHWAELKDVPAPKGTTVAIGGALASKEIFQAMRAATCSENSCPVRPKIAVLCSSKVDDQAARDAFFEGADSHRQTFTSMGFDPIFIPLTIESHDTAAHDQAIAAQILAADAVYLAGGDQAKHVHSLLDAAGEDTPVMAAIRAVQARGGLVAGSSAGAAAQGAIQYGEGSVYQYLASNRLNDAPLSSATLNVDSSELGSLQLGLGLLGNLGAIVCTHFDARARLARLLVAMREADNARGGASGKDRAIGVGLDEDTAIFVSGDQGRVFGKGGVFIADSSGAEWGRGEHFSVRGIRLHYLTAGDSFDFKQGRVQSDKTRTGQGAREREVYVSNDLLRPGEMTKLIEGLIQSGAERTTGTTQEGPPYFVFTLSRDVKTRAFLEEQAAVEALVLDVEVRGKA